MALFVFGLCVWLIWPAESLAAALVRFIHAVPGVGAATVTVRTADGSQSFGSVSFGQQTPFRSIRAGSFRWTLTDAGKVLATGTSTVSDGTYDLAILSTSQGTGVRLGVYRSAGNRGQMALVRVIHAAPELGAPMFMLDASTFASRLQYGRATRYYSVQPGRYSFSAMKPWLMKPGDPTLVDQRGVRFSPGQAYTELVIGSRGQMVRIVRLVDRGAPLTHPADFMSMNDSAMSDQPYVVRPGDSLWSIARRLRGTMASETTVENTMWAIWSLNAKRLGTADPNLIFPGQRLQLPA